jgi:hypothetical protein
MACYGDSFTLLFYARNSHQEGYEISRITRFLESQLTEAVG